MNNLFPRQERNDEGLPSHGEGQYEYLQRSARPEAERIRDVLEEWFSRYPAPEQDELLARFQSDGEGFASAFFELYLHEMLDQLDLKVEVHPDLADGRSGKSDFLVQGEEERLQFCLEASVVSGLTAEEKGRRSSTHRVYEWIESLDSADFFIGVHVESSSKRIPRKRALLTDLKNWLESLEWEDVVQTWEQSDSPAEYDHEFIAEGWRIEFYPIPKLDKTRGKPGVRPIGSLMETRFVDRRDPVLKRITRKGKHYKGPDMPYIVALNCLDFRSLEGSKDAIVESLFGKEAIVLSRDKEA